MVDPDTQRLLAHVAANPLPDIELIPLEAARIDTTFLEVMAALTTATPVLSPAVDELRNIEVPTPVGSVAVRIYRPPGAVEAPPLLVWTHGGGFVLGNLNTADPSARELCVGAAAMVASIDYPLAPEHPYPAAPEACYAVTAWLAERAAELGFDGQRIAVGGDSAGGNLAAVTTLLAAERGGPRIVYQLLVYPMIDMVGDHPSMRENAEGYMLSASRVEWFIRQYLPDGADRTDPHISPIYAEDLRGLPPATVITAELDPLRDEAEAYAARLREAGVPVELTRHEGLIHGFLRMGDLSPRSRAATEAAVASLRDALARAG
jgi:acetyl esterase/lipase